jgi:hypothetical protein
MILKYASAPSKTRLFIKSHIAPTTEKKKPKVRHLQPSKIKKRRKTSACTMTSTSKTKTKIAIRRSTKLTTLQRKSPVSESTILRVSLRSSAEKWRLSTFTRSSPTWTGARICARWTKSDLFSSESSYKSIILSKNQ